MSLCFRTALLAKGCRNSLLSRCDDTPSGLDLFPYERCWSSLRLSGLWLGVRLSLGDNRIGGPDPLQERRGNNRRDQGKGHNKPQSSAQCRQVPVTHAAAPGKSVWASLAAHVAKVRREEAPDGTRRCPPQEMRVSNIVTKRGAAVSLLRRSCEQQPTPISSAGASCGGRL
jgi:hypothetical protein